MTDNEIIKALECCSNGEYVDCFNCPYKNFPLRECSSENAKDVIAIINRQKAEIERFKIENAKLKGYKTTDWLTRGISPEQLEREKIQAWKSEAIKEFAEMLKWKATAIHKSIDRHRRYEIDNDFIDGLVKEMVGECDW